MICIILLLFTFYINLYIYKISIIYFRFFFSLIILYKYFVTKWDFQYCTVSLTNGVLFK